MIPGDKAQGSSMIPVFGEKSGKGIMGDPLTKFLRSGLTQTSHR
jgi:hypothetical protein